MAAGQALVIITRNIDLSVGSIAGVSAYVTGDVLGRHLGTNAVVAVRLRRRHRRPARADQRRDRRLRAHAVDHRHARHAGHLPDVADQLRRRQDDHGRLAAPVARRPPPLHRRSLGDYELRTMFVMAVVVVARPAVRPRAGCGPGGCSTPSARTPRPPARPGCPCAAITVTAFAACGAARRTRRVPVARLASARSRSPPARASSSRRSPPPLSVASARSAARAPSSARCSAPCSSACSTRASARVPQISEFMRDAVLGLLILLAVIADGLLPSARRTAPIMSTRRSTAGGDPVARPRRRSPMTTSRAALAD